MSRGRGRRRVEERGTRARLPAAATHSPLAAPRAGPRRPPGAGPRAHPATALPRIGPIPPHDGPMAGAKKGATLLVKLLSTAGTGFFYVKRKNARTLPGKLQFVKHDPRVNKHVLFTETKLK